MIQFLSSLASYFILMVIIVALCCVSVFAGIKIRKNVDKNKTANQEE